MASLSDLAALRSLRSGIVCIDGPAGAGKTTLAASLEATVVHTDEMLDGWHGLLSLHESVTPLVLALAAGHEGHYRHYDWHAGAFTRTVAVSPAGLVVIEGVGAWNPSLAGLVTAMVWVDAPAVVRRQRGCERGDFGDHWEAWASDEAALFARDRTRDHADLVIETA